MSGDVWGVTHYEMLRDFTLSEGLWVAALSEVLWGVALSEGTVQFCTL